MNTPVAAPWAVSWQAPDSSDAHVSTKWDLLLICVTGYLLTAVGRVHQLFPALELLRPAILTGLFAIVLFALDRQPERRLSSVFLPPTKWVLALLVWMVLSVPGALVAGTSFAVVFDNFIKTVVMFVVIAASVRSRRDVERLACTYFAGAVIYSAVVTTRFQLGSGDAWRLGRLYYYDANDFATLVVSAMSVWHLPAACRKNVRRTNVGAGRASCC